MDQASKQGVVEKSVLGKIWRGRCVKIGTGVAALLVLIGLANVWIVLASLSDGQTRALADALATFILVMAGGYVGYRFGLSDGKEVAYEFLRMSPRPGGRD